MSLTSQNPIETLAAALYSACYHDLPDIHYEEIDRAAAKAGNNRQTIKKARRPAVSDCQVIAMFPQMWGSTTTGFGGIGGAAMTSTYTTVIECEATQTCAVYFGGRFAYLVPRKLDDDKENEVGWNQFMVDMANNCLESVAGQGRYRRHAALGSKPR